MSVKQLARRAVKNKALTVRLLVRLAKSGEDKFELTERYADELKHWATTAGLNARIQRSSMSESVYVFISDDDEFTVKIRISMHGKGGPFKIDFGHGDDDIELRVDLGQHWGLAAFAIAKQIPIPPRSMSVAKTLASKSKAIATQDFQDAVETELTQNKTRDTENTHAHIEVFPQNMEYGVLYASQYNEDASALVKRSGNGWSIVGYTEGDEDILYTALENKKIDTIDMAEDSAIDMIDYYNVPV